MQSTLENLAREHGRTLAVLAVLAPLAYVFAEIVARFGAR